MPTYTGLLQNSQGNCHLLFSSLRLGRSITSLKSLHCFAFCYFSYKMWNLLGAMVHSFTHAKSESHFKISKYIGGKPILWSPSFVLFCFPFPGWNQIKFHIFPLKLPALLFYFFNKEKNLILNCSLKIISRDYPINTCFQALVYLLHFIWK